MALSQNVLSRRETPRPLADSPPGRVFWPWRGAGITFPVTIPDLGHCAGSGTPPVDDSVRDENQGRTSGVCPACSGRFDLHHTGVMSLHDAAEAGEREAWAQPSD